MKKIQQLSFVLAFLLLAFIAGWSIGGLAATAAPIHTVAVVDDRFDPLPV